jgi:hypothetical protein
MLCHRFIASLLTLRMESIYKINNYGAYISLLIPKFFSTTNAHFIKHTNVKIYN